MGVGQRHLGLEGRKEGTGSTDTSSHTPTHSARECVDCRCDQPPLTTKFRGALFFSTQLTSKLCCQWRLITYSRVACLVVWLGLSTEGEGAAVGAIGEEFGM